MRASRILFVAVLAVVVAATLAPSLPASPAQNLPGSSWAVSGTMKASISAEGESESVKGPVDVLFQFGPQAGLLANEFRMTIEDEASETLVFGGAYVIDEKGKPKLTVNEQIAASEFLALWDRVVGEFFPGISLPTPDVDVDKAKVKAKPKAKSSGDTFKVEMSSKWYLDFFAPQHIRVKMKLKLKAKNGVRIS